MPATRFRTAERTRMPRPIYRLGNRDYLQELHVQTAFVCISVRLDKNATQPSVLALQYGVTTGARIIKQMKIVLSQREQEGSLSSCVPRRNEFCRS